MNVATKEPEAATELKIEPPSAQLPAIADPHAKAPERAARKRDREPSIANIATAIANVTREVGIVAKAGFNAYHRYKFAQMQDVLQKLTPLLAKHGIVIVQTELGRTMFDDERAISVQYEFTIAHSSGEVWPDRPRQTGLCRCRDSKGGFDDKALNKCHTAARKYFLLALFQIATGEEDDADIGHNDGPRRPVAPAPNVMRNYPPHDPQTGEVIETASPSASAGEDAAPAAPVQEPAGAAGLSIEAMAREAAMRGPDVLKAFFKARNKTEQAQLRKIESELVKLYPAGAN